MIVFIHGVPETAAVWDKVRAAIGRESVALSLPGFGCERPDGFDAGMDGYLDWVLAELEAIEGPIDLVGHDWGAAFTYAAAQRGVPGLRSWVADVGNIAHPDYEWHDIGKLWQTPGDGEAFVEAQNAMPPEDRAGLFEAMGVPADDALAMARAGDAVMGQCILDLYRSAVPNPHAVWGPWQPAAAPGLVLCPTDDPFGECDLAAEVAGAFGARFETLEGVGHFWPYQAPDAGAALLTAFWDSLD